MPSAPSNFVPLHAEQGGACPGCTDAAKVAFSFDFAYQPIVDVARRGVWAHEALVRGPAGEGAG